MPTEQAKDSDPRNPTQGRTPPLGTNYGQATFERHAALLNGMSHSMYAQQRATVVRQLQRDYGNRYVRRLVDHIARQRAEAVQPKLTVGPAGDKYEQEADQVAKQVMGAIASSGQEPARRAEPEEEELQMKPVAQRQVPVAGGNVTEQATPADSALARGRLMNEGVGTGWENHWPPEVLEAAAQAPGREKPALQAKGVRINTDAASGGEATDTGENSDVFRSTSLNVAESLGSRTSGTRRQVLQRLEKRPVHMGQVITRAQTIIKPITRIHGDMPIVKQVTKKLAFLAKKPKWQQVWKLVEKMPGIKDASPQKAAPYAILQILKEAGFPAKSIPDWEDQLLAQQRQEFEKEAEEELAGQGAQEPVDKLGLAPTKRKVEWDEFKIDIDQAKESMRNMVIGKQGVLGDCWLISSKGAVTYHAPEIIDEIIQPMSPSGLNFTVKLHPIKKLTDILVISTPNVTEDVNVKATFPFSRGQLLYAGKGMSKNQGLAGLVALIEKAVASKYGSYGNVQSKNPRMGLAMLTGKDAQTIPLDAHQGLKDELASLQDKMKGGGKVVVTISSSRSAMGDKGRWGNGEDHAMVLKNLDQKGARFFDQGLNVTRTVPLDDLLKQRYPEVERFPGNKRKKKDADKKNYKWRMVELTWVELDPKPDEEKKEEEPSKNNLQPGQELVKAKLPPKQ